MKIATKDLTSAALDWAVCMAEGMTPADIYISQARSKSTPACLFRRLSNDKGELTGSYETGPALLFSRKWEAAGPIIEREGIGLLFCSRSISRPAEWFSTPDDQQSCTNYEGEHFDPTFMVDEAAGVFGPTLLVAAMRCYVAKKLGKVVDVPDELIQHCHDDVAARPGG